MNNEGFSPLSYLADLVGRLWRGFFTCLDRWDTSCWSAEDYGRIMFRHGAPLHIHQCSGQERVKTPEEMWNAFIAHLEIVEPLGKRKDDGKPIPHKNFLGSVASYKKIFLEANPD